MMRVAEYVAKLKDATPVIINCISEDWHIETYSDAFPYTECTEFISRYSIVDTHYEIIDDEKTIIIEVAK